MRKLAMLVILAGSAQPALAGHNSCSHGGGGGSSGGGSSGGGSSGGGYSSGSYSGGSSSSGGWGGYTSHDEAVATHEAVNPCANDSDVVGYRQCTRYGTWSKSMFLPHVFLELGTNFRQFGSQVNVTSDSVTHGGETFAYRVVKPGAARDAAMTSNFRVGFGLWHGVYIAADAEIGGLVSTAPVGAEMMSPSGTFGMPTIGQQRGLVVGGLGVAGIRIPTHHGSLALEGAGGFRAVNYKFTSTYHECYQDWTYNTTRGVAEARARGELWLNPWLTAGAMIGASVVERGDWSAGVFFGVHTRSFGGQR